MGIMKGPGRRSLKLNDGSPSIDPRGKFMIDKVFNLWYTSLEYLKDVLKMTQVVSMANNWCWWWNLREGFVHC
jgi:hypothetical protein